ncbi:MAG: hypothetical protein O8C61_03215 [Candidatus Methanoperedens sp.]|nr:hypothetical protein [Candidatus Methanoperedens sp.]
MVSEQPIKKMSDLIRTLTLEEAFKMLFFNIVYLFMLTLVGVLVITIYNYFYPVDMTSDTSVLTAAFIFMVLVILDFGLLNYDKVSPTLIAMVFVISPIILIYKLFNDTDFIQVNRNTPNRLKRYIPFRVLNIG